MKKTIVIFFLIFVFISCGKAYAFMEYFPAVKAGGEYKKQKFDSAVEDYKKALNYKSNWNDATFNLGNTYFRQKKYDEAEAEYNKVAENGTESLKAQALYNLGNIAYEKGDLKKAEDFYKKSLRINPKDKDAKYNLELCKKEQEKKDQNKCDNPQQDQNKDQQDQNKDQQDKNKDQQDKNKDQQYKNKDQQDNQEDKTKQGALRYLQNFDNFEKERRKANSAKFSPRSASDEDW